MSVEYEFNDAPVINPPANAELWASTKYCDKTGWYSLPNYESFLPKPTRFEDGRQVFLDPMTEMPAEIAQIVSGKYDVKTWGKGEFFISIEAETVIFMKFPSVLTIISYTFANRLPTFKKDHKPIVFMINLTTISVRLSEEIALLLTRETETSTEVNVYPVDYSKGFCCSHPSNGLGIIYGSYAVKSTKNCLTIPPLPCSYGHWGYFIQLFSWGGLVIPKGVEINSGILGKVGASKLFKLGMIFCPPNVFLNVTIEIPGTYNRTLEYQKHFALTAQKESETDISACLLIDGQLCKANHSFDLRKNSSHQEKKYVQNIVFKVNIEKEERARRDSKFTMVQKNSSQILIGTGGPTGDIGHLLNNQVVGIFDAEISQYYSMPPGIHLSNVFKKLGQPVA